MQNHRSKVILLIFLCILLTGCAEPEITTFVTFVPVDNVRVTPEGLELAQKILQERLDMALSDVAQVRLVENTLEVGLANERDLNLTVELATHVGAVDFFHSDAPFEIGNPVPANAEFIITDADIDTAKPRFDESYQSWLVDFNLTPEGSVKFADYTQEHLGDYLVIARENVVISSPYIDSVIKEGEATIFGEFDKPTAELLAAQLNSGRLPFPLIVSK